jgi:hypothetical protein
VSPAGDVQRLSADLEAALLRELVRAWHGVNLTHFRSVLLPPTLALSDNASRLGEWQGATRTLVLSRRLVLAQPWPVIVEVLKHEMAHQYVHEILRQTEEAAHGPSFRAVCERLGIDASASGLPPAAADASATGESETSRPLRRVARLLALAQSQNLHEAESAMREAQRLMLKHNLEEGAARAGLRGSDRSTAGRYSYRQLGPVRRRVDESERLLAMLLSKHFFVESIWIPSYDVARGIRGSALEVCGTPENLEMAAYVYDFLSHTAENLWREHKRSAGLPGDRERRTFLSGVMLGFSEKLDQETKVQQQQGLIWRGDAELGRYLRQRHPHIRRVAQRGQPRTETRAEGRKAGRNIILHRPITSGSTGGGGPRLLPPRRGGT